MTQLASFDASARRSGAILLKKSCSISSWLPWAKECDGAIDDIIGITWHQTHCQWHHITKSHVAPHFEYLDLRNVIPWASHDADIGTNGVTWPKNYVVPHLNHLDLRNEVVSLMMPSASIGTGVMWPKSHVAPHFDCLWLPLMPVPIASYDQKRHDAPHFHHHV